METLTADEFKKRYGVIAASDLDEDERQQGIFQEIKDAFAQGVNRFEEGRRETEPLGGGGATGLVTGVGKMLGGAAQVATSPLAPVLNRTVQPAVDFAADKISDIPTVQKFSQTSAGQKTAKVAETAADYASGLGLIAGAPETPRLGSALKTAGKTVAEKTPSLPNMGKVTTSARNLSRDVIPTSQNLIDHNLAVALDLTPGDLKNIAGNTGNEVGPWMAKNNLIGTNKATTLGLIRNFFTDNYKKVRTEIGNVPTEYDPTVVPRFQDALKAMAAETQDKIGLEKTNSEITTLLKKEKVTLNDVQRAKELFDEYFSLYKVTGDVQQGVTKQGLANVRKDIQSFIEEEVEVNTGADIRALNNNVSTAKSLADAIEARTPRGLTRAQLTWRDAAIGMGLTYFGSPLAGLAAVAAWKIATSPSVRLRFARWVDTLNDAQKANVSKAIRDNNLTPEIKNVLDLRDSDRLPTPQRPEGGDMSR